MRVIYWHSSWPLASQMVNHPVKLAEVFFFIFTNAAFNYTALVQIKSSICEDEKNMSCKYSWGRILVSKLPNVYHPEMNYFNICIFFKAHIFRLPKLGTPTHSLQNAIHLLQDFFFDIIWPRWKWKQCTQSMNWSPMAFCCWFLFRGFPAGLVSSSCKFHRSLCACSREFALSGSLTSYYRHPTPFYLHLNFWHPWLFKTADKGLHSSQCQNVQKREYALTASFIALTTPCLDLDSCQCQWLTWGWGWGWCIDTRQGFIWGCTVVTSHGRKHFVFTHVCLPLVLGRTPAQCSVSHIYHLLCKS